MRSAAQHPENWASRRCTCALWEHSASNGATRQPPAFSAGWACSPAHWEQQHAAGCSHGAGATGQACPDLGWTEGSPLCRTQSALHICGLKQPCVKNTWKHSRQFQKANLHPLHTSTCICSSDPVPGAMTGKDTATTPRSCLEEPKDGAAWWAAVSGVAQSRPRLERLSSSSRYDS